MLWPLPRELGRPGKHIEKEMFLSSDQGTFPASLSHALFLWRPDSETPEIPGDWRQGALVTLSRGPHSVLGMQAHGDSLLSWHNCSLSLGNRGRGRLLHALAPMPQEPAGLGRCLFPSEELGALSEVKGRVLACRGPGKTGEEHRTAH